MTTVLMESAEDYAIGRHMEIKRPIATARETVQTAEDAREIAVKRIDEVRLADASQASSEAQARSQAPTGRGCNATREVVGVRRQLAVRTIFNFLGPLTNPAGASRQLIGVSDARYLETMAGVRAARSRHGAGRRRR